MIEGVVVANRLAAPQADRLRAELWAALGVENGVNNGVSTGVSTAVSNGAENGVDGVGNGVRRSNRPVVGAQRPGRPGSDDRADDQRISARVA
jgi:hypothetical protein